MYMPPECFEGTMETSPSMDVWAIGVMFYAMIFGTLPFNAETEKESISKIKAAKIRFPKAPVSIMAKEIILLMMERDPEKRVPLLTLLEHEYLQMDGQDFKKMI